MEPDISIRDPVWHEIKDLEILCKRVSDLVLSEFNKSNAFIAISFADDATLEELNGQWRGKLKPTNVLSFPANAASNLPEEAEFLGDIIIASGVTRTEAQEQNKSWTDHVTHLIVHGILHLLGEDHETEPDALRMETTEIQILAKLGLSNPYEIV